MRRYAILAVAGAALAAAAPAHASRFDLRTARFTAQFEGTRTVTWNEPSHQFGANDCYHRTYSYGSGDETWKVKSKPTKLLVSALPGSKLAVIKYGTWDPKQTSAEDGYSLAASGIITRNANRVSGWNPGPCGGAPGWDPARDQKCGSRLPSHTIGLTVANGKLLPELGTDSSPARGIAPYDDCEIQLPRLKAPDATRVPERSWPTAEIAGRVSLATLFGKRQTVTITGGRKWDDVLPANGAGTNGGTVSTSATIAWKLTLTRAKGRR